ncbi:MAG: hypothetical protein QOJ81_484 [Chloroflexota bacterium]|jgi:hypothetical protein|nr:hypothetical protein [Chloroflexota bacterium]
MKPGLDRTEGHADSIGDLQQGKPEIVVEDEHRPLFEGQAAERAFKLVPVVDRQQSDEVALLKWQNSNIRAHPSTAPGLGVALVRENAVKPGFETIGIAQAPELLPGADQCALDGILGHVAIAQDPKRDGHAAIADSARKGVEGLSITPLRTFDQRLVHRLSLWQRSRPVWTRTHY